MKHFFAFLFASCFSLMASAQSYNMSNTTVTTCSGNFFDSGGSSSNYGNNQNLTMTFTSPNGNRIVMAFNSLSTEYCCDHLYIYDGPSTASPLIGTYFSNPGTITSTGTSLTFVFISDAINTNAGWNATISCGGPALTIFNMSSGIDTTCSGYLFDDGGLNGNYSDNQDVVQTFSSGTSDQLHCDFTSTTIDLQSGDTLFVYDGATTAASPLAIYVSGSYTEDFITSGSNLTFRFKSDGSSNGAGWAIILMCTTAAQIPGYYPMSSGTRYVCDGYFYDEGGAGYYSNNLNLTQTFTSYNGNRLTMFFGTFDLYGADRLYIYDGPTTAYQLIGSYGSSFGPGTITSTGSSLTFVFTSDNINPFHGWVASISCAGPVIPLFPITDTTISVCEGLFYDSGGQFGNYADNEDRVMTFTSSTGQYLKFDFNPNYFNIGVNDSLFIYDGNSTSAPMYAVLTNSNLSPFALTSNTTSFTFRFKSDGSTNNTGWQAWITCVSAPDPTPTITMTGGSRYVCGGYFYDPGGPSSNYPGNEDRVMTLYSNSGCRILFQCATFGTEFGSDILYVYDGPNTSSPSLGWYSGNAVPGQIQSTGNSLTFRFVSDGTNSGSGWGGSIYCLDQPTATVTASGPTTICQGDSVVLSASTNTSYSWNTGATTQNIPVSTPGSYWVSVTNAMNCTAISPMTFVNTGSPTAVVTATGPTSFCQGDSVTLTASGGGTYLWSDNSTGPTLNVSQSGTYYVIADNGSCTDTSATIAVNVNAPPVVTLNLPLDTFCINPPQTFTLTGGSPAGGIYSGPGVSGGQLTPMNAGAGTHTMTYTYTDGNGCTNTTAQSFVVDICNGIGAPVENGAMNVSPNPTSDLLLIRFANNNPVNQLELLDVTGRVVLVQAVNGQPQVTVSLKELPVGVYLLRASGERMEIVRVVKE